MKKKKVLVFILVLALFAASFGATVYAISEKNLYKQAVEYMQMLELISNYYVGDEVTDDELQTAAFKGMFDILDPYSRYLTPEEYEEYQAESNSTYVGIGVTVTKTNDGLLVTEIYEGSPAEKGAVQIGDIITEVAGTSIANMDQNDAVALVKGERGSQVTITVLRKGELVELTLTRDTIHMTNVFYSTIEDMEFLDHLSKGQDNSAIRYLQITEFDSSVSVDFEKAVADAKANEVTHIILDLRDNLGGSFSEILNICDMVIPEGPVAYLVNKDGSVQDYYSSLRGDPPFTFVVLTNENSASASELFTSVIKESGTGVSVGRTTYGKGIAQVTLPLDNGGAAVLTISEYLTRNKNHVHNIGVAPDVEVYVPSYFFPEYTISANSDSEDIRLLQELLVYMGYAVDDNGYGEITRSSIAAVQEKNDLPQTGLADLDTIIALNLEVFDRNRQEDIVLEKAYRMILDKEV